MKFAELTMRAGGNKSLFMLSVANAVSSFRHAPVLLSADKGMLRVSAHYQLTLPGDGSMCIGVMQ